MGNGVILLAPGPVFVHSAQRTIQDNATVVASGDMVFNGQGSRLLVLVVNITAVPTGVTPSLIYALQEVDPLQGTALGASVTGVAHTGIGTELLRLPLTLTGAVEVSWTVTGVGASFTGVNATLISKVSTTSSGTDSSGNEHPLAVDPQGRLILSGPSTINKSSVPAATSDTLLIIANPFRRAVIIFNDTTTAQLKVSFGATPATTTSFTMTLGPGGYFEVPERYTGEIRGIWDSSDPGSARITELL